MFSALVKSYFILQYQINKNQNHHSNQIVQMFYQHKLSEQISNSKQPLSSIEVQRIESISSQNTTQHSNQLNSVWQAINRAHTFWQNCLLLLQSQSEDVLMHILCLLHRKIQNQWRSLNNDLKISIKLLIDTIITNLANCEFKENISKTQLNLLKKLDSIVVEIVKCQWQTNWPTFIKDICFRSQNDETQGLNSLRILRMIFEELFTYPEENLTSTELRNLRREVEINVTQVIKCLERVWINSKIKKVYEQQCIVALMTIIKWIPPYYVFFSCFFKIIQQFTTKTQYLSYVLSCLEDIINVEISPQLQDYQTSIGVAIGTSLIEFCKKMKIENMKVSERQSFVHCWHLFLLKSGVWLVKQKQMNKQFCMSLISSISKLISLFNQPTIQSFEVCEMLLNLTTKAITNPIFISQIAEIISQYLINNIPPPTYAPIYYKSDGKLNIHPPTSQDLELFETVTNLAKLIASKHILIFNAKIMSLIDYIIINSHSVPIKIINGVIWSFRLMYRVSSQANNQPYLKLINFLMNLKASPHLSQNYIYFICFHLMQEPLLLYRKPNFAQNYLKYYLIQKIDVNSSITKLLVFQSFKNICQNNGKSLLKGSLLEAYLEKFIKLKLNQEERHLTIFLQAIAIIIKDLETLTQKLQNYLIQIINPSITIFHQNLQKQNHITKQTTTLIYSALSLTQNLTAFKDALKFIPKTIQNSLNSLQNLYIFYSQQLCLNNYPSNILQLITQFKKNYIKLMKEMLLDMSLRSIFTVYLKQVSQCFIIDLERSFPEYKQQSILQYLSIILISFNSNLEQILCNKIILRVINSMKNIINSDTETYPQIRKVFFHFIFQITQSIVHKISDENLFLILEYIQWMIKHSMVQQVQLGLQSARNIFISANKYPEFAQRFTQQFLISFIENIFLFIFQKPNLCINECSQLLIIIIRQLKSSLSQYKAHQNQTNSNISLIYTHIVNKFQVKFPNKSQKHKQYLNKIFTQIHLQELLISMKDYLVILYRND